MRTRALKLVPLGAVISIVSSHASSSETIVYKCADQNARHTCAELVKYNHDAEPSTGPRSDSSLSSFVEATQAFMTAWGSYIWATVTIEPELMPRFDVSNTVRQPQPDFSKLIKEGVDPTHPHLLITAEVTVDGYKYEFPPIPKIWYINQYRYFCPQPMPPSVDDCKLAKITSRPGVKDGEYNRDQPADGNTDSSLAHIYGLLKDHHKQALTLEPEFPPPYRFYELADKAPKPVFEAPEINDLYVKFTFTESPAVHQPGNDGLGGKTDGEKGDGGKANGRDGGRGAGGNGDGAAPDEGSRNTGFCVGAAAAAIVIFLSQLPG